MGSIQSLICKVITHFLFWTKVKTRGVGNLCEHTPLCIPDVPCLFGEGITSYFLLFFLIWTLTESSRKIKSTKIWLIIIKKIKKSKYNYSFTEHIDCPSNEIDLSIVKIVYLFVVIVLFLCCSIFCQLFNKSIISV